MKKKLALFSLLTTLWLNPVWADMAQVNEAFQNKQYETALELLKPLLAEENAEAQWYLGWMYDEGKGVTQNKAKAVEWYAKAAEQGNVRAQFNIGLMYSNGEGVTQNKAKAFEWYAKAAEQGAARAQFSIGVMYYDGEGVTQNKAKAFEWNAKAAEQGYANAQFNIGLMHSNGEGVTQNKAKAVEWYTLAAEQGDVTAQNNLGYIYEQGEGAVQNYEKAANLYHQAALAENNFAMRNLGQMYRDGKFFEKNLTLAHAWLNLSAKYGHKDAPNERDEVAKRLNQKQLNEAQTIASNWKAGQKMPKVVFKQDKTLLPKTAEKTPNQTVARNDQPRSISCQNSCRNGSCIRTFSDGRKERWQAPMKMNPFTNQIEFDITTNACG